MGLQDTLTDYYNVIAINMFRYFFLFLFVISINSTGNKSVILVSKSKFRLIQILRGTILAVEMCFAHYLFLKIGLNRDTCYFCKLSFNSCSLISDFFRRKSRLEKVERNIDWLHRYLNYASARY